MGCKCRWTLHDGYPAAVHVATWPLSCARGNRRTDRQTDKRAQTKYCNPCCACAPRVNEDTSLIYSVGHVSRLE